MPSRTKSRWRVGNICPRSVFNGGYHRVHNDLSNAAGPNYTDPQVGVRVSMPLFGQMVKQGVNNIVAALEGQITDLTARQPGHECAALTRLVLAHRA